MYIFFLTSCLLTNDQRSTRINAMRLRSGYRLPQAGTGAKSNGESRPLPSGLGSPTYSGGDNVSRSAQLKAAADDHKIPGSFNSSIHNVSYDNNSDQLTDSPSSSFEPYSPSNISYTPSVPSSPSILSSSPVISSPLSPLDVTQEANSFLPVSTKAGKIRVRMSWSKDVNIFIMRTYYYVTKLETDKTMYRRRLHELFCLKYPDVKVTEQRISDQMRTILRNKYISEEILHTIKEDVRKQLENECEKQLSQQDHLNNVPQVVTQPNISLMSQTQSQNHSQLSEQLECQSFSQNDIQCMPNDISTQNETIALVIENHNDSVSNLNPIDEKYMKNLILKLRENIAKYAVIDPKYRPKLPKLKYCPQLDKLLKIINKNIVNQFITDNIHLEDLHTLIYSIAVLVSTELNYTITGHIQTPNKRSKPNASPPWQFRLEKDIQELRADCGILTQYINNNRSKKVIKKVEKIFKKRIYHTRHESNNKKPEEFLDTIKQKLALKAHRLKRYKKAQQRRNDNTLFSTNEKIFYRKLGTIHLETNSTVENDQNIPTKEHLESFWSNIWEKQTHHNEQAEWIREEADRWSSIEEMEFTEITQSDIKAITYKLHNWKSPGIDKLHNFWYKKLTSLHKPLAKNITNIILGNQNIPNFIATGITYMLPKTNYSPQPSDYRPITCLPTIYKIITSSITLKINEHIEHHKIIAEEQKGCRRGHMGCKEQLIIDSTIHKHASTKKRNLHCTYIDYQKAFDSIPHSWLIQTLRNYKINKTVIEFLKNIMNYWKTTLNLNKYNNKIETREIIINKGIYQGDSLSPLWFCLALNPLSHQLNQCKAGYHIKSTTKENITVSHLIYMDDIKLYAQTEKEMKKLIETTSTFSKDINMQFGLDKCKTVHLIKGKIRSGNYAISDTETITAMGPSDLYKYLGYRQLKGLDHTKLKIDLTTEYKKRVNAICKTQLSGKHLIKALNTYAIPILTYSFGLIKWSKTDINNIERLTRTTLTRHNHHHPNSAIERLTIKRQDGGRGLIDIYHLWQKQLSTLTSFFNIKAKTSNLHRIITQNDDNFTPLNLKGKTHLDNSNINHNSYKNKIVNWKEKILHGRHPRHLEQSNVDSIASNKWLKVGNLFPETEGFAIAIQDQVINTKNYRKHVVKDPTVVTDKCRKCHKQSETIQHITGACTSLTQTDYTHRHNQIANIIHQKLAFKHSLLQNNYLPYYKYTPQKLLENSSHKLYYDRAVLTDKTIHYNRPDIILQDKINKVTYLIDIAVPNTHNLHKTITEKVCKYAELKDEVTRIWKQEKVYVVPIVLSTTGIIPHHLHNSLKLLNLENSTYITIQKAAILNTCRTVRKFMQLDIN